MIELTFFAFVFVLLAVGGHFALRAFLNFRKRRYERSLEGFIMRNYRNVRAYEFRLVPIIENGGVMFYLHPLRVSGETTKTLRVKRNRIVDAYRPPLAGRLRALFALLVFALSIGTASAKIVRSREAVKQFHRLTGFPTGRPGYVVDHVIPLCAGGDDAPSNMQWQDRQTSFDKDSAERRLCAALSEYWTRENGYRVSHADAGR